jgi:hypothetical protein
MYGYHSRVPQVEGAFQRFSEASVDLGETRTQFGRDLADAVIARIEAFSTGANSCPVMIPGAGFIAGSLGRRTQEQPLDDIDGYLVMSAPGVRPNHDGVLLDMVAHYSEGETPLVRDGLLSVGNNLNANAILERIAAHLGVWFPDRDSGIGGSRKTCYLRVEEINIDLSPVIWYSPNGGGMDQYWMPAGNGQIHWKPTNPKEDQRNLTTANQAHNGELLKIVRMMKWWNANRNAGRLKGIHLETLIVNLLEGQQLDGWANALHYLFANLGAAVGGICPDPSGLGSPLDSSLSDTDRAASMASINAAYNAAFQASQLAAADYVPMALVQWRTIFPV